MRSRRALITTVVGVAVTGLWWNSEVTPVSGAIPPIHIRVPHIEVPPTSVRPLENGEWLRGNPVYEERLRAAGSEEALALEESLRRIRAERMRAAIKDCAEEGTMSVLDGSAQAKVNSGEWPSVHDAVASAISGCFASQLPDDVPEEAIDAMSTYLADQVLPPAGEAVQTSSAVDVSLQLPTASVVDETPTGSVSTSEDDGSSFPWGILALIGGGVAVALAIGASRKSS